MLRPTTSLSYSVFLVILIEIAVACANPGQPTVLTKKSDPRSASLTEKISTFAREHAELDMFSGAVLVAKNGKIIYEEAFGDANKDLGVKNRLNTRFNIGSIGKTFTAVSIMLLSEQGKLRLSDPLSTHVPEFPFPEGDSITIHHLLTHTAGLGDYLEHEDYFGKMHAIRKIEDALPLVYDQKPECSSGEKFQYSNSGYLLLGAIIEKVSGLSYPTFLEENIFKPLEMSESGIVYESEVLDSRSIGYTKNWDNTYESNVLNAPAPCSAGGLRTTVNDLLKFDQALRDSTLLTAETKQIMYSPTEFHPTYACGWEIKEYYGNKFVGHSGGTNGVEAYFYRFIDAGYTIITLSNYDGNNGQVCSGIEAILFKQKYSLPTIADANFTLGYALQSKGQLVEAQKVFARNSKSEPPHLLSLFFSANSRIRGDFELEEALGELDRYIQFADENTWPPLSMIWERKGQIFKKIGRKEEAIHCLNKAIELDPDNKNAKEKLEGMLRE